eukprot:TRINITY_DN4149_c0_g1_i11.p2 TRINITY_DN4149_c0_g1~~TRINITY_DN4149_c0_g1_i11.p2  ORF type:complete len:111 (+),score=21.90 TRINITY_DN4149_c0_g1_i11:136-468(+)
MCIRDRFDIELNRFETLPFKMTAECQNPFVVQINAEEIIIFGGWSDELEDLTLVEVMNMNTGKRVRRPDMNNKGWGIYPPYFVNDTFYIFMTGEEYEEDGFPDTVIYSLN